MDFDAIRQSVLGFVELHKAWTPLVAGVLAFCESLAFLSLLVPATVILVGIGALIGASDIPFWPVVIAAAIGAALGDWISYEFGRYFKEDAKGFWPMSRYPEPTRRAEDFLRRWGAGAVAIGRFFGPVRAVIPLIAGIFGVNRLPFQVANVLSAAVWAFVLLAPGAGLLSWFQG
ncbi:DedA family protein [Methylobacterium sp. C25]|uniref:DedA family protein n=1 Tax=Methylobacterium sp. C25 TaxID=2721622 RepID=UPI001F1C6BE6|nr:DedA family protein [Methylobacterium sp. C25]MCE4223648.1 DedA family protein [Methylobacterium sp. C25]